MSETPRPPTDQLTGVTGAVEGRDGVEPTPTSAEAGVEVVRHEERLVAGVVEREAGKVRIRKRLEALEFDQTFPYAVERAEIERVAADPEDSGEIETLADGTVSIPVLEERVVVEKRLVVSERLLVRKRLESREQRVTGDLVREVVSVDADETVQDRVEIQED